MTKYWCVNFDGEDCLTHGIKKRLWLMQYQYADDQGHRYQGGRQTHLCYHKELAGT